MKRRLRTRSAGSTRRRSYSASNSACILAGFAVAALGRKTHNAKSPLTQSRSVLLPLRSAPPRIRVQTPALPEFWLLLPATDHRQYGLVVCTLSGIDGICSVLLPARHICPFVRQLRA